MSEIMWYFSFCDWLLSFSIRSSGSSRAAAYGRTPFHTPLEGHVTSSLSIHPLMGISVAYLHLSFSDHGAFLADSRWEVKVCSTWDGGPGAGGRPGTPAA